MPLSPFIVTWHAVGMLHFLNGHLCLNHLATRIPYPSLSLADHAQCFVMFPPSSIDCALGADCSSNTWRACIQPSLSEPTAHPHACLLALDRAPPSQTVWRSPSSSPCPHPSGHAHRPLQPAHRHHVEPNSASPSLKPTRDHLSLFLSVHSTLRA
jgi:hypothetical protein